MFDGADLPDRLADHQAEAQLVGSLLGHPEHADALPSGFDDAVFHHPDHAEIFRHVLLNPTAAARFAITREWAGEDLERQRYVGSLIACVVNPWRSHLLNIADYLVDLHQRREARARLRAAADALEQREVSLGDTVSSVMSSVDIIVAGRNETAAAITMGEAATRAIEASQRARESGGLLGLSTGFAALDELLGGLEPGRLYVVGARPSMGKSALGGQVALHAARGGASALLVSLEMSALQLGQRALADVADVPLTLIARGRYSSQQADRVVCAQRELDVLPLRIRDVAGQRIDEIARQARAAARSQAGLRLLVLDHLHITELPPEASRLGATWGVGQVSRGLKRISKDLGIPVVALAQLNRGLENREDKRPTLADLRQSGDIEQDADVVIFLHRPEYFLASSSPERPGRSAEKHAEAVASHQAMLDAAAGRAELIVAKNRDGSLGTVHLRFDGDRTRFSDADG